MAQLEYNVEALLEYLSAWSAWRVCAEPGLLWVESAIPNEAFNKVLRCQLANAQAASRLFRLRDEAFSRGAPLAFWLGPRSGPKNLAHILEELGFRPTAQAWGMVREVKARVSPEPMGIEVHVVRDYRLWPSWVEVFGQSFGLSRDVAEAYGDQLAIGLGMDQPLTHIAAFVNGKLAGTASLFVEDRGVAGIYNLATATSARGQGVGDALLGFAMAEANNKGCRWVVLRSTAGAYRFYLDAGFQPVARYQVYVATPPVALL